ncbi:MAG: CPBP family intramembrane metalloprotease [Spirosoma sp.]|nr:CPBP family intramembrane metalloprotease [Spirosoma sp.]
MPVFLRFPLVRLLAGIMLVAVPYFVIATRLLYRFLDLFHNQSILFLIRPLTYLTIALVVVALYGLYVGWFERRTLTELLPTNRGRWIMTGFLYTSSFTALVFVPLWLNGNLTVAATNGWRYIPQALTLAVMAATVEEVLFRALLFRLIEEAVGSIWAILLVSLLFGLMHYANPGTTVWRAGLAGLEAGLTLPVLFILTRNLWLCISAHATWDALNYVIGIPESGGPTQGYITSVLTGDERLTGGAFGIEFSLLASGLASIVGLYLLWVAYRRNALVKGKRYRSFPAQPM